MNKSSQSIGVADYQNLLSEARKEFSQRKDVRELFEGGLSPDMLNLFMIHWSSMSAALTQPIPDYLATAESHCKSLGLSSLAEFFKEHTEEEDGHHMWAEADTRNLVQIWNDQHSDFPLDADILLNSNRTQSVQKYHQLHEDVLAGGSPWAELAIDVEIELITTQYGPALLTACSEAMTEDGLKSISFLSEHVRFDFGHTETNLRVVDELLTEHPEFLNELVRVGKKALVSYGDFLGEALSIAKEQHSEITCPA